MEPFLGQIQAFGFNFAPRGWAFCDGQLLPISSNTALFSLLGTTFGGDGRTTFGLPDLRGRSIKHAGSGPGLQPVQWGEKGGRENVMLIVPNLPAHNHNIQISEEDAAETDPSGHILGISSATTYSSESPNAVMANAALGNTGSNQAFSILNPSLGVYVSIALTGIYPSRS